MDKSKSRAQRFSDAVDQIRNRLGDLKELKDEMENWRDTTLENLQSTDEYQQIEECVDTLQSMIDEIELAISNEPEFPRMFG